MLNEISNEDLIRYLRVEIKYKEDDKDGISVALNVMPYHAIGENVHTIGELLHQTVDIIYDALKREHLKHDGKDIDKLINDEIKSLYRQKSLDELVDDKKINN